MKLRHFVLCILMAVAFVGCDALKSLGDDESEETKEKKKKKKKSSKSKAASAGGYTVGKTVEVKWKGSWYPATILKKKGKKYKIHYTGYGSKWDEWVSKARMRQAAVTAGHGKTDVAPTTPPPQQRSSDPGHIPDIPSGRSSVPTLAEWGAAPMTNTQRT